MERLRELLLAEERGRRHLNNYYHHGSRMATGSPLGERLRSKDACVASCDSMGYACAGFTLVLDSDQSVLYCTPVAHGYGLALAAESDFYRKKLFEIYSPLKKKKKGLPPRSSSFSS